MERISLLSLSLMLISSFQLQPVCQLWSPISANSDIQQARWNSCFPAGLCGCGHALLNSLIERWMSERQMIVAGLLLFSTSGLVPLVVQDYPLIFLSRFLFGLGTGMINAKAISIISERYSGNDKTRMLGYQGSAEVVGSAHLDFYGWTTLTLGWPAIFAVYGGWLPVLLLYILLSPIPKGKNRLSEGEKKVPHAFAPLNGVFSLMLAVIAGTNHLFSIPSLAWHACRISLLTPSYGNSDNSWNSP